MFLNPSFIFLIFFKIHVKKYGSTRTWPNLFAMSIDDPKIPWPNPNTTQIQHQQEPIHYQPKTHCDAPDWFWYWFMLCGCVLTSTSSIFSIVTRLLLLGYSINVASAFSWVITPIFLNHTQPNPPQNPSIPSPISLSYTHNGTYSELERCKWKFTPKMQ